MPRAHPLLDPAARLVVGHRGSPTRAPENTLPSFRLAVEEGADVLEFDIRLTSDGVPVVMHDPTLDRTTDRTGPVSGYALADLAGVDAGARFSPDDGATFPWRGRDARIPTLAGMLAAFPDMPLLIELKVPEAQEPVRAMLERHDAVARCVIASEHDAALDAFREPPFHRGASMPEAFAFWHAVHGGGPVPDRLDHLGLFVPERFQGAEIPTPEVIAAARRAGAGVHVWTVNDTARAEELWRRGVGAMVTDRPAEMLALRERLRQAG